jgi:hypothetical protein
MELPTKVNVYCQILGLSGNQGTLVAIRPDGCYEVRLPSQQGNLHTMFLPVAQTCLIFADPEPDLGTMANIER